MASFATAVFFYSYLFPPIHICEGHYLDIAWVNCRCRRCVFFPSPALWLLLTQFLPYFFLMRYMKVVFFFKDALVSPELLRKSHALSDMQCFLLCSKFESTAERLNTIVSLSPQYHSWFLLIGLDLYSHCNWNMWVLYRHLATRSLWMLQGPWVERWWYMVIHGWYTSCKYSWVGINLLKNICRI